MRAPSDPPSVPAEIELSPMRRRHVRDVLAIERVVYPRPWSAALFFSEIAQRSSRYYLVAHLHKTLAGYGGLMCQQDEGHITTLAVRPEFQHQRIGSRVLFALVSEARQRGMASLALEVRVANWPAQRLYSWFGFRPVGVRKNYYSETGEDALVMWVDDMQGEEYGARLGRIEVAVRRA
ncbi:MAG: ribosomal protein S18-alanine N-acetyltransferase [Actinobacteria bacterium]|nr:ribosomal protein S18-alanine N-acetyltransferase [Actinomycetota bacterium]